MQNHGTHGKHGINDHFGGRRVHEAGLSFFFCLSVFSVYSVVFLTAAEPPRPKTVDFKREVLPILEAKCIACHGAKRKDGKLDLRTRAAMLKGGNTGAAIEPGKPDKSLLVELIHFNEMPPKKSKLRVTAAELQLLKAWIAGGAPEK